MKRSEIKTLLAEEREELAAFLATLNATDWASPSMCEKWSVLDVGGHLASTVGLTRRGLFARSLRYGAGHHRLSTRAAAPWTSNGPDPIVSALADPDRLGLGFFYPVWALSETVVHHQDIRHGLARPRSIPEGRLVVALDFFARFPFMAQAKRHQVSMRATDINWSHGNGPEVHGPAESLLMAITGRMRAVSGCAGEGINTLLGVSVN